MSHCVNLTTQFKDIETLKDVFKSFGWNIVENEKCQTYPTDPRRAEIHRYVAKNPVQGKSYDVGINVDSNGNAYFVCDFFDSSIASQLGNNLQKIKQGYAVQKLKQACLHDDLDYKISELPSGELCFSAGNNLD